METKSERGTVVAVLGGLVTDGEEDENDEDGEGGRVDDGVESSPLKVIAGESHLRCFFNGDTQ